MRQIVKFNPILDTRIRGEFAEVGTKRAEVILAYSGQDSSHIVFTYTGGKYTPYVYDGNRSEYMTRTNAYKFAKEFLKA